jgi:hypothetical protein
MNDQDQRHLAFIDNVRYGASSTKKQEIVYCVESPQVVKTINQSVHSRRG